jgi:hypothetical protein
MLRPAIVVTLLLAVAGCSRSPLPTPFSPPPPPSAAVALRHLGSIVEVVESGDLSGLCRFGGGNCPDELANADPAAVPGDGPIVLGTAVIPPRRQADGAWSTGGLLLDLCGRDGRGDLYDSQMLVFQDASGRLLSINTLYWTGMKIATSNEAVGRAQPPRPCPLDGVPAASP